MQERNGIAEALASLKGEGRFAVEQACSSETLRVAIHGVGPLTFPLSAAKARALIAVAQPAPYGRREQTLYDPQVRDTWEIDAKRVHVDAPEWNKTLDAQLMLIGDGLGLPRGGTLSAVFDKVLIYAPGQFFAAHQDSERADDMVATLIVELPCRHKGGATVVEHGAEKLVYTGAKRAPLDLSLLAFYADCLHEVEPVQSGHRIVLTYRLHHRQGSSAKANSAAAGIAKDIDRLAAAVEAYFAAPIGFARGPKLSPARPERLVYLLDHEYTPSSLAWDRLKNADRIRVGALGQVAARLDCESFLALADIHENWMCEEDESDGRYGRRERYRYRDRDEDKDEDGEDGEDGVEADSDEHELIELIDSEFELRNWIGPAGEAAPAVSTTAEEHEICCTLASSDMKPWKSEHEGNMGNYGNTVNRWYHRAALVMWPRDRSFAVRARVSPAWAVAELGRYVAAGDVKTARAKATSMLPFWDRSAPLEKGEALFRHLCLVLRALDDAPLAAELLSPFGLGRLTTDVTTAFVALVEHHGLTWSQRLIAAWHGQQRYGDRAWPPSLAHLCQALLSSGETPGGALARWFLERQLAAWTSEYRALHRADSPPWDDTAAEKERSDELLSLLDGARAISVSQVRDALITLLTNPGTALPPLRAGKLLQASRKGRTPAEVRALGLHALYHHVTAALEAVLGAPPRREDDWTIEPPKSCSCPLCVELAAFLRAPNRIEYTWPLAKERRQHVHILIERHRLPVSHTTRRTGSPQKLVLKKSLALFDRERHLREEQTSLLAWLRRERTSFAERG